MLKGTNRVPTLLVSNAQRELGVVQTPPCNDYRFNASKVRSF